MQKNEMTEYNRSGDCAELESKLYSALFAAQKLRKDAIFYIRGLWSKVTEADKDYLWGLLDFFVDADSTRVERHEELTIAILGLEAFSPILEPEIIAYEFAAGDGDDDFAEFSCDLSNGWICNISCWRDDPETHLTLNVGDVRRIKAPTLTVRPLCFVGKGRGRYLDIDFDRDTEHIPGTPVDSERFLYHLNSRVNALVSIPGVTETLKVLTLSEVRRH